LLNTLTELTSGWLRDLAQAVRSFKQNYFNKKRLRQSRCWSASTPQQRWPQLTNKELTMVTKSLSYCLTLSQAQLNAFCEFKKLGSELICKYHFSIHRHERWGSACVELIILEESAKNSHVLEHNFYLTEKQACSLYDMIKMLDELQEYYSPDHCDPSGKELYQKMMVSLAIFRSAVEEMIATMKSKK